MCLKPLARQQYLAGSVATTGPSPVHCQKSLLLDDEGPLDQAGGDMSDADAVRTVQGFKWMVALQLATRIATFLLNVAVVRHVEPSVSGLAAQLLSITNITLFLSRESLRRTVARSSDASAEDLALLPWLALFPLGLISALVVGALWLWGANAEELLVPHFRLSVALTLLANMIELTGEAAYSYGIRALDFRQRFVVESGAVLVMCVTLFSSVVVGGLGLLSWALAQVAYSVASSVGYHWTCRGPIVSDWRRAHLTLSQSTIRLWLAFQWQVH
jgi:hypothetical protein